MAVAMRTRTKSRIVKCVDECRAVLQENVRYSTLDVVNRVDTYLLLNVHTNVSDQVLQGKERFWLPNFRQAFETSMRETYGILE